MARRADKAGRPKFAPSYLRVEFDPLADAKRPWATAAPHSLHDGVIAVNVPKGFRFDMASVPSWLLWLAPPNGNHQRAAMFHDWLYRMHPCTKWTADAILVSIMEHDGVPKWRRSLIWLAVYLFGTNAWKGGGSG